ncbi:MULTISPECIES: restriction endonuclease subunit S [unclassified Streptomyces]|uniref:restriction endonuclease subunit S n=1 Tax=unclassified Streptomyces TaxID=2593676 RepID=UPI000DAF0E34|nr:MULTISPECIES: restriction endonuclease subunit S [unclassified Streptomyces]PZT74370.1 restriction endonuclease subunit S [Streptomyces sp. AC1-42T]PZT82640.1 restriction endonuclease subunit S [Streptomyces sp. AC1-42W]
MTTDSDTGPEPTGSAAEGDVTEGLPAGWVRATLEELSVEVQPGFASGKHNRDGVGVIHLRPMNITRNGMLDTLDARYVVDDSGRRVERGDVLFNNTNSPVLVGKTAWVDSAEPLAFSNHMTRLRCPGGLDGRFLAAQLHHMWATGYFKSILNNHVNQASVSRKALLDTVIVVPPLAEQHRIVAKLDDQLAHVEAGESAVQTALAASAALRNQITGAGACGGLDEVERFSANLEPADVDDGILPGLPKGWKWARLGELAEVVGGVTKDSKKQNNPEYVEVPYLRVANVQRGRIVLDRVEKIKVSPKKAQSLRLEVGDVLLNEGGDRDKLGRGWVWEGQIENCIHQNHVFRARVKSGALNPRLLAWHANAFGKSWCDRNGKQTVNLASISLRRIKLMPVPVPPESVQTDLVRSIENHLAEMEAAQQVIQGVYRQGVNLRNALLHAAFTGTLVPQDPDDEPASVLLDRIRAERAAGAKAAKRRRAPRTTPPTAPATSGRPVPSGTQEALPL